MENMLLRKWNQLRERDKDKRREKPGAPIVPPRLPPPAPEVPSEDGVRCLFCSPRGLDDTDPPVSAWPKLDTDPNEFFVVLNAIKRFVATLDTHVVVCRACETREIILFVGRSGVGKSVALNLAAGNIPRFVPGTMGELRVDFDSDSVSKVFHSSESGTLFPFVLKCKNQPRLIVDCPGFFENRSPGIEFLQRCVIKKMLEERAVKVVLFKSVLTERDTSFADLLKSEVMVPGGSLVCFTKAWNDTPLNWEAGVDSKEHAGIAAKFISNPLKCILLKTPSCYPSAQPAAMSEMFLRDLNTGLSKLTAQPASIMSKESDALGMLVNNSTAAMQSLIREALSQRLRTCFIQLQFQPYHIPFIKNTLNIKNQFPNEIIRQFQQIGFIQLKSHDSDILLNASACWETFQKSGLRPKGVSCVDIINEPELSKLQNVMHTPELEIKLNPETSLPDMLLQWVTIRERFWLEYVAYKGQMMQLLELARTDIYGTRLNECKVLVEYRLRKCRGMEEAWCVVAKKLQDEIQEYHRIIKESAAAAAAAATAVAANGIDATAADKSGASKQIASGTAKKVMEAEAAYKVLELVLKPDLLEKCLEVGLKALKEGGGQYARNLLFGGIATGAGAGAVSSGGEAAVAGISTGAMVGITVVAAVGIGLAVYGGVRLYMSHEEQKQLNEGGLLGLDFSQFSVEMGVWAAVESELAAVAKTSVLSGIYKIRGLFKKFELDFSFNVKLSQHHLTMRLNEIRQLENMHNQHIDQWINIVAKNQQLASTIIGQLIGRAKGTAGCSFQEHSLTNSAGVMRIPSCCSNFLTWTLLKQCEHCKKNFHDPDSDGGMESSCVVNSRAILCVDLMNNTDTSRGTSGVDVYFTFERSYAAPVPLDSVMKETAARFSLAIYDFRETVGEKGNNTFAELNVSSFKAHWIKERNILFCVAVYKNVAYVVFRGTEPASVLNWGTNFAINTESFDECAFHSGYLSICQQVIDMIRVQVSKHATIVFTGHSLGGALAHTLHTLYLLTQSDAQFKSTYSIAFGAPATFGGDTDRFIQKHGLAPRFLTLVNKGDPVPMAFRAIQFATDEAKKSAATSGKYPHLQALLSMAGQMGDQVTISAAVYHYVGTYVFFESQNGFVVEKEAMDSHDSVVKSRWMNVKKLADCRVDDHRMEVYENFVRQWSEDEV
ncbi:hypothetical protein HDU77_004672 [Chytriomyces hyalinus]|nr:hypothetical protein HDU77_004672 [Chytriomyces hyalinus]